MFVWSKKKERILVFGAGSGGVNYYNGHRRRYDVLGFLDNNAQRHGERLIGKLIYAPQELAQLEFDRIVIASDYYAAIYPQLINLGVPWSKIDIHHPGLAPVSRIMRLRSCLRVLLLESICHSPELISDALLAVFRKWEPGHAKALKRYKLHWLDSSDEFKVHVFRPSMPAEVQGPRFVGREVGAERITLPEVALHRFRDGLVGSVSRSVVLADERAVVERVTTTTPRNADYSVGDLFFHGKSLVLMQCGKVESVDKGILINGGREGNYYHWVVEILSQLQFIAELPEAYRDYPILISANSQKIPSIKALVESEGITRPFIYLETQHKYRVADLLLITAPNNMIPNFKNSNGNTTNSNFARPESIQYLCKSGLSLAAGIAMADLPKRVFLARKGHLRRYNQQDVVDLLEPYGFVSVHMEDLDVHQQVAIMANAEVVLGPTGAAWTNIMFASPGTQALCWMAEEYGDLSCFSNLAAIVGVDLEFICYRTGARTSLELYYRDYTLDCSAVRAWLQRHLPDPV